MDEEQLRQQVCRASHQLWLRGLVAGAGGLVALEMHRRRYLVTPPDVRRIDVQPGDVVCVDLAGVELRREVEFAPEVWTPHRVSFQQTMNALPEAIRQGEARHVKATVLAHPPRLTALLALRPEAQKLDLHQHASIPVVFANQEKHLGEAVLKHPVVALPGVGVLSTGPALAQALSALEGAEQAADITITLQQLR